MRLTNLRKARAAREHLLISFLYHEIVSDPAETYDAAHIEAVAAGRPERVVESLERLRNECRERNMLFVVGKQQARSLLIPREKLKGVTYADEIELVRQKLHEEGRVSRMEMNFLVHERVLAAEQRWALENDVPFADVVAALDHDRDVLVSWVHLNPRGNAMIADTYAREILGRTCPRGAQGAPSS